MLRKHVWPGHHPVPAVLGTGAGLVPGPNSARAPRRSFHEEGTDLGRQLQLTKDLMFWRYGTLQIQGNNVGAKGIPL